MRAEIAERQRAEDRVDDRVEQHIGIGVTRQPAVVRNRDPADHKRATFDQCVHIETIADAVIHFCIARIAVASARSSG